MINALTYQEFLKDIQKNSERTGVINDTIGVLITRPDLDTGKSILNSLEYYHHLTGKSMNFYLPGYGAYWNDVYPDGKIVTEIDNVKWYFSNAMFVDFIKELEKYSRWEYSGESELLLIDFENKILKYDNVMSFYLDNMLRDQVINSIPSFFQRLFRLCKDKDSLYQISSFLKIDKGMQITKNKILEKLPYGLGDIITQEKYFNILNISK